MYGCSVPVKDFCRRLVHPAQGCRCVGAAWRAHNGFDLDPILSLGRGLSDILLCPLQTPAGRPPDRMNKSKVGPSIRSKTSATSPRGGAMKAP